MKKTTLFVLAAWLLTLIAGCHKEKFFADDSDLSADLEAIRSQLTPVERKFFDYHYAEQHNPYVKPGGLVSFRDGEDEAFMQSLIDKVLVDNSAHRFAPAVIDHIGYPAWSRSMILRDETRTHRVAVVPFFKGNDTLTRAFLLAAKPNNNQWVFRLVEKGFVLGHLNYYGDTTAVAIREKAFCLMNLRALDKKLFHKQDLEMLQWIWQHRDVLTGSVENANVLDFRCTWLLFVPIVECISNDLHAAFTPEGGELKPDGENVLPERDL